MNKHRTILLLVGLISLLNSSGCYHTNDKTLVPDTFVGKWRGEVQYVDSSGKHVEEIQIDIVDTEHLYYYSSFDLVSDDGNKYGFPLKIQLISEKQMILQGEINDKWNIEIQGNNLMISDGILFHKQTVVLTRISRIERVIVSLGAILIILLMYFLRPLRTKQIIDENIDAEQTINRDRKLYMIMVDFTLHALVIIITITVFTWGFTHITKSIYFYFFGMPWRVFIILEAALCLFVIGIKMRNSNNKPIESPTFTPGAAKYYLSMILSIVGGLGIMVSIVMWITFMIMVQSYLRAWYLY